MFCILQYIVGEFVYFPDAVRHKLGTRLQAFRVPALAFIVHPALLGITAIFTAIVVSGGARTLAAGVLTLNWCLHVFHNLLQCGAGDLDVAL